MKEFDTFDFSNTMKKFILLSLFIGASLFRLQSQSISYKIISDDVKNLKPLVVNLYPFYADAYGVNITLGWQAHAILSMGPLQFQADYRRAYPKTDINYSINPDKSLPFPKNGLRPLSRFEALAQLNFSDRKLDRNLRVVLSSSSYTVGNTRYTNTKYISVPGTKRKIVGVRGGMYWLNTAIDFSDIKEDANGKPSLFATAKDNKADTIHFGIYGVEVDGSPIYSGNSMNNVVSFIGGISFQGITNLVIRAEGYGQRRNSTATDFYIDGMFAPVIQISDIKTFKGRLWDVHSTDKTYWGWRMGFYQRGPANKFGFAYKFEWGVRPGLKGDVLGRMYLDMTMGFDIPFNLVPKAKK